MHDRLVDASILDLARREARIVAVGKVAYGPSWNQSDINALLVREAAAGQVVVRLKGATPRSSAGSTRRLPHSMPPASTGRWCPG